MQIGIVEGVLSLRDEFSPVIGRAALKLGTFGDKATAMGRQMSDIGTKLTQSITLPIVGLSTAALKFSSDFQTSLTQIETLVGINRTQVNAWREDIFALARETGRAPKELAEGLYYVTSAGIDASSAIKVLSASAKAAALGLGETSSIADAATSAMNAYGEANLSASEAVNIIALAVRAGKFEAAELAPVLGNLIPTAAGMKIKFEEVAGVLAVMSRTGLDAATGAVSLNQFLMALQRPGKEAAKILGEVHLNMGQLRDIVQKPGGLVEAMRILQERTAGLSDEALARVVPEVRAFRALMNVLSQDADTVADVMGQVSSGVDVVGDGMKRVSEDSGFKFKQFLVDGKIELIKLGDTLVPTLKILLEWGGRLVHIAGDIAEGFAKLPRPIQSVAVVVVGLGVVLGPVLFTVGQLAMAWGALASAAPGLVSAIGAVRIATLGLVAAVGVALLAINSLITGWRDAMQANIEYNVRTSDTINGANLLSAQIRKSHGSISSDLYKEAKAGLDRIVEDMEKAKARVASLRAEMTKPMTEDKAQAGRASKAKLEINAAVADLSKLQDAHEQLQAAMSATKVISDKVRESPPLPPFNSPGMDESTAKKYQDLREELIKTAKSRRDMAEAFKSGSEIAVIAATREHELTKSLLSDTAEFGRAAGESLKPLRAGFYDANLAAETFEETYKGIKDAITETGKLIGKEFKDRMVENAKEGVAKFVATAKEALRRTKFLRSLQEDFEFSIRVGVVDEATPHLSRVETSYLNFLRNLGQGSISEGDRVMSEMSTNWGITVDDIKAQLSKLDDIQIAANYRGAGKTPAEIYQEERAEIERLMIGSSGKVILSTKDGLAAIARLTDEYYRSQIDRLTTAWGGLFSFLGSQLGGVFSKISSIINTIQSGASAGRGIGSYLGGLGQGGAAGSAAGGAAGAGAGAIVAAWLLAVDYMEKATKEARRRLYEYSIVIVKSAEGWSTAFSAATSKASYQLRRTVEAFAEAIGGTVRTFAALEVSVRRDGKYFRSYVQGVLIGQFADMESAVEAALLAAFKDPRTTFAGLSDLVAQGLREILADGVSRIGSLDELQDFLVDLREISEINMSEGGRQLESTLTRLSELWQSLARVSTLTPAVTDAFNNLVSATVSAFRAWSDSITGRQRTQAEIMADREREIQMFNARKKLAVAEFKMKVLELQQLAALTQTRGRLVRVGIDIDRTEVETQIELTKARATLLKADIDMTSAYLDLINAQIDAINEIIRQLEAMPDLTPADLRPTRGDGGRGRGNRSNVLNFIEERRIQLANALLSSYQQRLAGINREYQQQLIAAGKHNDLRRQLLELQAQEIAQAAKENRADVAARFATAVGGNNPFQAARDQFGQLTRDVVEAGFGAERTADMLGRLAIALDNELQAISDQMTAGVFGDLAQYITDASLRAEMLRQQEIINFNLKMVEMRTTFELLKAQGKLSAENLALLQRGFDWLDSHAADLPGGANWQPPAANDNGPGRPLSPSELADAIQHDRDMVAGLGGLSGALQKAREKLLQYTNQGISPLTLKLREIRTDFDMIRRALGDTAEVMTAYSNAVADAIDNFLEPIRRAQQDLLFGDTSIADPVAQFAQAQADFDNAVAQFNSGDLTVIPNIPDIVQRLLQLGQQNFAVGSSAYAQLFQLANSFLSQVQTQAPIIATNQAMGTSANPMQISGMATVAANSETQVAHLESLYRQNEVVISTLRSIDSKTRPSTPISNVA